MIYAAVGTMLSTVHFDLVSLFQAEPMPFSPNGEVPGWHEFLAFYETWRRNADASDTGPAGFLRWAARQSCAEGDRDPLFVSFLGRFQQMGQGLGGADRADTETFLLWLARCSADFAGHARADGGSVAVAQEPAQGDDATTDPASEMVPSRDATTDEPASMAPDISEASEEEAALPERIGPFVVKKMIGRGGMGVIYQGERCDESRQVAAVKVLQRLGDPYVSAFKKEMRLLASLQHPNIAFFLDHGTLSDGRPWLALEYIDGLPLDQWFIEKKPSLGNRLKVFLKICEAVSFAHNNLIIHRDLKPNNILIQANDEPKLLDFGIASILDPDTEIQETVTFYHHWACTPEYASPEQLRRERLTAATDVYSLGVLLYQLLTGLKPYQIDTLSPLQMLETLTGNGITKPSRVVQRQATGFSVAPARLRGDLDVICMKALAADRNQRYPSVAALAEDLRRFHLGLPILARPMSTWYHLSKFVQRNRNTIVWVSLLFLVLLGAAGHAHRQSGLISQERDRAAQERDRAERVGDFMVSMFKQVDPARSGQAAESISALDVLGRGREEIENSLHDDPQTRSELLLTMGEVYRSLGKYRLSHQLLEEASGISEALPAQQLAVALSLCATLEAEGKLGEARQRLNQLEAAPHEGWSDTDLARLFHAQGRVAVGLGRFQTGRNHYEAAAALLKDPNSAVALDLYRDQASLLSMLDQFEAALAAFQRLLDLQQTQFGAGDGRVLLTLASIGNQLQDLARYDEAEAYFEQAARQIEGRYGREHPLIIDSLVRMGQLRSDQSRVDEAEAHYREALVLAEKVLDDGHPTRSMVMTKLSELYQSKGDHQQAETYLRQAYNDLVKIYGDQYPGLTGCLLQWGNVMVLKGDFDQAERLYRQALALEKAQHENPGELGAGKILRRLARLEQDRGRYEEAEQHFREILALRRERLGEQHPEVALVLNDLGYLLSEKGAYEEAERCFREALALNRAAFGERHHEVARSLSNLGMHHWDKNELDEAETFTRQAIDQYLGLFGERHIAVAGPLDNLCSILKDQRKFEEAEQVGRRVLAMRQDILGEDHPYVANSLNNLAAVLSNTGDLDGAEALYRRSIAIQRRELGRESLDHSIVLNNLAVVLYRKRDFNNALATFQEVLDVQRGIFPEGNPNIATTSRNLGFVLRALGRHMEAEPHLRNALAIRLETLGAENFGVTSSLLGLADNLVVLGAWREAEALICQALDVRLADRGPDDDSVALCYHSLGRALLMQGRLADAAEAYQTALTLFQQSFGPHHYRIYRSLRELSEVNLAQGKLTAASEWAARALEQAELGDFDRAAVMLIQGDIALRRGDLATAEAAFLAAAPVLFEIQNPLHLARLDYLNGRLAKQRKDWPEAERLLLRALERRERAYATGYPVMLANFCELAEVYLAQNRPKQALALLAKAQADALRDLPPDHAFHHVVQSIRGRALSALGRRDQGDPLLRRAFQALENMLGDAHYLTLEAGLRVKGDS